MNKNNLSVFDKMILLGQATWWQMELPSGSVFFGSAKAEMLGYPESNFKTYQDFTNLLHPDDYEKTMKAFRDHLEGKIPAYEALYRIKTKSSEYIMFYDYGQIVEKTDKGVRAIGFVWKINNITNYESEIQEFKNLVTSGEKNLLELFTRARDTNKDAL